MEDIQKYLEVLKTKSNEEDFANAQIDKADVAAKLNKENLSGDIVQVETPYMKKIQSEFAKICAYTWKDDYEVDHQKLIDSIYSNVSSLKSNLESFTLYKATSFNPQGYQNILSSIIYIKNLLYKRINEFEDKLNFYKDLTNGICAIFDERMLNYLNLITPDKTIVIQAVNNIENVINEEIYAEKLEIVRTQQKDFTAEIENILIPLNSQNI